MEIYKSKFVLRTYDVINRTITSTWLSSTEKMTIDEFKAEMLTLVDVIIKHKATYLLSIMKDLRFPIVPDLQNWISHTIVPKFIEAKLLKQAIIIPDELIAQLSMEQTIDEVEHEKHEHQSKFFSDIEEAKKWFNK